MHPALLAAKAALTPENIKRAAIAIVVLIILVAGFVFYRHIDNMQEQLTVQAADIARYKVQVTELETRMKNQKDQIEFIGVKADEFSSWKMKQAKQDAADRKRLDDLVVELGKLRAISDPKQYADAVNAIINKRIKCIGVASGGAPLPNGEKCE